MKMPTVATGQKSQSIEAFGHKLWCQRCGFRYHAVKITGKFATVSCKSCGSSDRYEKIAGGYIPESFVRTLENHADAKIEQGIKAMLKKNGQAKITKEHVARLAQIAQDEKAVAKFNKALQEFDSE
jgi:intergrase/recombinase